MKGMQLWQIVLLAVVQGFAELLPVSSSAHVILAQKLMGLDPGAPEMTFLLVMLHTGTMFAVLFYFWPRWKAFLAGPSRARFIRAVLVATACTGILGLGLKFLIERVVLEAWLGHAHGEVEHLFRVMPMIALALASAGTLILWASRYDKAHGGDEASRREFDVQDHHAFRIGLIQGLCLPFRGFSRSGATISAALAMGVRRALAEDFSFALAVVLTPPVIVLQLRRLLKAQAALAEPLPLTDLFIPGLLGMVFAFGAGLLALRWLSAWLEKGRWNYFGMYCLGFAAVVFGTWAAGL